MAKIITVNTGPFKDLPFPGHEDADAFDKEAGEVGACVEEADASVCYRGTLPEFHDKFTPVLEQMTGEKRGINQDQTEKNRARAKEGSKEKVKDVPESFITFANRAKTKVDDATWKLIDAEARKVAAQTPVDASPSKRMAGVAKAFTQKADSWLTLSDDELEAKVTSMLQAVPDFELERDDKGKPERLSLARGIQRYVDTMI